MPLSAQAELLKFLYTFLLLEKINVTSELKDDINFAFNN